MTNDTSDLFHTQFQFASTKKALMTLLEEHLGKDKDITTLDSRTAKLLNALRQAANSGIDAFQILISVYAGRRPSSSLLFAHQQLLLERATPGQNKWQYLLWFLNNTFHVLDKCERLNAMFMQLRGSVNTPITDQQKINISELARTILELQNTRELDSRIVILCFQWFHGVSGIKAVVDFGKRDKLVAAPYLLVHAKDQHRLAHFTDFFSEVRYACRRYLATALVEALKDKTVEVNQRERIALFMLDQMNLPVEQNAELLWFWKQYAEALIEFYHEHEVSAHLAKVTSVCQRVCVFEDQADLPMSPAERSWELLACFANDEATFNKLWLSVNNSEINMRKHINEYDESHQQCQRQLKRYLAYVWMDIVKKLVRSCYRDNNSLNRLTIALRQSPLGPVSLIIEKLGSPTIPALFDRRAVAIVLPADLTLGPQDPIAVSFLLSITGRTRNGESNNESTTTEGGHVTLSRVDLDKMLVNECTSGHAGRDAALRLVQYFSTLPPKLQQKVLLLALPEASDDQARDIISQCLGAERCSRLLSMPNLSEAERAVALTIANKHGHLLVQF